MILVAEDDPDINELVQIILGDEGHRTEAVTDATSAIEFARRERPDLVLLDVAMPGDLDGLDVCRQLRDQAGTRRVPILLLTARADEDDVAAGFAAGASDYLIKPFAAEDLLTRVEALLSATELDPGAPAS